MNKPSTYIKRVSAWKCGSKMAKGKGN